MKFSQIPGHSATKARLIEEVRSGRMPHARMFVGKEGDAKILLARAWITYLMCQSRLPDDSCGKCAACAKNSKLIHPDVHLSFPTIPKKPGDKPVSDDYIHEWREAVLADPHLNINDWLNIIGAENKQANMTAEECRAIIHKLSLKPYESDKKILLMWLPEYLRATGNSLLKILEEPAEGTYFILLTQQPDKILPTILSRVQTLTIPRYTEADVEKLLQSHGIDSDAAKSASFMAMGNANAAFKIINSSDEAFNPTLHFRQWMRLCFMHKIAELMKWSDSTGGMGRENIKAFLTFSLGLIRECLAVQKIPNYNVRYDGLEKDFILSFSSALHFTNIETLYVQINKTIAEIERNANPKMTLTNLSIQLAKSVRESRRKQV